MPWSWANSAPALAKVVLPLPTGPTTTAPRRSRIASFRSCSSRVRPADGQGPEATGGSTGAPPTSNALPFIPLDNRDVYFRPTALQLRGMLWGLHEGLLALFRWF